MKSMFSSSLGKFSLLIFLISGAFSSSAHAFFIRGNGGWVVKNSEVEEALDIYERKQILPSYVAHYASADLSVNDQVLEYIQRIGNPEARKNALKAFENLILNRGVCSFDDLNKPGVDNTWATDAADLHQNPWSKNIEIKLVALNFRDKDNNYFICSVFSFDQMKPRQQAVLLFHELIYVLLEQRLPEPPTPKLTRHVVAEILSTTGLNFILQN